MWIESLIWKMVVVFMMSGLAWDAAGTQPMQDEEAIEAQDGGSRIPPGP